jgi:hypothetical protein
LRFVRASALSSLTSSASSRRCAACPAIEHLVDLLDDHARVVVAARVLERRGIDSDRLVDSLCAFEIAETIRLRPFALECGDVFAKLGRGWREEIELILDDVAGRLALRRATLIDDLDGEFAVLLEER